MEKIVEKRSDGMTTYDLSRKCPICNNEIRIIVFETTDGAYSFQPVYTIHYNSESLSYRCSTCAYKISLFQIWEEYKKGKKDGT